MSVLAYKMDRQVCFEESRGYTVEKYTVEQTDR